MEENRIVLEGKNKEKLLDEAINHFNVSKEDLLINIIQEKNKLFTKYYKIEFKLQNIPDSEKNDDRESMDDLLKYKYVSESKNLKDDYSIKFTTEGVKLLIHNIENMKTTYNHIYSYICKKNIDSFNKNKINEALENLDTDIIIAPSQKENIIDDEIIIDTSKDNMKAYIEIIPGEKKGKKITYDIAVKLLEEKIKYGLDKYTLEKIIEKKFYNKKFIIANGKQSIKGEDGYIDYKFDEDFDLKPNVLNNGSVDFRNLGLINNVSNGEVLAKVVPPSPGENGINIFGEEIPSIDGIYKNVKIGNNTSLYEDKILSKIDGQVRLTDGKIEVLNIYNIEGNVDSHTGNIDFNGTVSINDSVNTGFKVEALGDVYIRGVVEDAFVKSNGNIYLTRGIVGKNRATLEANGEIISKYIENSKVKANEDIIADAILHSEVESNGSINVQGKKGLIVGGKCKAQFEVHAKTIGSPMETNTLIEVGTNTELKENLDSIKSNIDKIEKDIFKIQKTINILEKSYKQNNLSDKKIILFKKLLKTSKSLNKEKLSLITEYDSIENEVKKQSTGTIIVDDMIYPGVNIVIGNHTMFIKEIKRDCRFTLINGSIKIIKD